MNIHGWEWLIILVVVLLLFGGKKIPELMSGLGKGIRSFKKGLNDVEEEIKSDPTDQNTNTTPSNNNN
ncbi:MAG: twin-arginine translocase TatA/TatE family subunit [Dysgonamonadaceae bacterium]